jgi:hypothetical protein
MSNINTKFNGKILSFFNIETKWINVNKYLLETINGFTIIFAFIKIMVTEIDVNK